MLASLLLTGAAACAADVVQPQPAALTAPAKPDDPQACDFVTNDCEVCSVDAAGQAHCSSTGIACTPTKRWCLIPKK